MWAIFVGLPALALIYFGMSQNNQNPVWCGLFILICALIMEVYSAYEEATEKNKEKTKERKEFDATS